MYFSGKPIPGELFKMARDRMLAQATFTPEEVRSHLLREGRALLVEVNGIEANHGIIANRVMHAARKELVSAGEVAQLKRGTWAKAAFLAAAGP